MEWIWPRKQVWYCNRMKNDLHSEWEVIDLGEPSKIIGIEIKRSSEGILISQKHYIESILQSEEMDRANPVATPLDPNVKLTPDPDGSEGSKSNSFARLLGELQFVVNSTRPDIVHAVNRLASYIANLSMQHIGALK
jgi:uncharacterized protein YuzE